MKILYLKLMIFFFLAVYLTSCSKDNSDDSSNIQPDGIITVPVSGTVVLPTNSTIALEGASVNAEFSSANLNGSNYDLPAASNNFGIIYFIDASGVERLMGLEYPGQQDHTINSSSTVLAMLMKMPSVNSLSKTGKLNLIELFKANPNFQAAVSQFEISFLQNKPLFDTENSVFNEKLVLLFESTDRSQLSSETPNITVIRNGRNVVFQNPGVPFSQYIGVYKNGQRIDEFALGRYKYFAGSISEIIGGIITSPEVIERNYSMVGDGEFEFRIRTGKPFDGTSDYESSKAFLENCSDQIFDILTIVQSIPYDNLNKECVRNLRNFAAVNYQSFESLLSQPNGTISSFSLVLYQIAETTLNFATLANECMETPAKTNFWKISTKFIKFVGQISTISAVMNTTNFLAQLNVAPSFSNICYTVQGESVSECNSSNELIVNGDFSMGNIGFFTNYTYCNSANCLFSLANNGYTVANDASTRHDLFEGYDHTNGNGQFMIINGAVSNYVVWKQTVNVSSNSNFEFEAWICTLFAQSNSNIVVKINGEQLGTSVTAPYSVNQWIKLARTWNSGSNTVANIEIFSTLNITTGNDFGLDDISFRLVDL